MFRSWENYEKEFGLACKLAYITMSITKFADGKLFVKDGVANKEKLYDLKADALALLNKTKYLDVSYCHKKLCDRYSSLYLCDKHNKITGNIEIWLRESREELLKCDKCEILIEKNYYDLYVCNVGIEGICEINLYMPYPIGKHFFANRNKLKHVSNIPRETCISFGKRVRKNEKDLFWLIYQYRKTFRELKQYLGEQS